MSYIYTTAPKSYDGFGTIEIEVKWTTKSYDKDTPVRLVQIEDEHLQWQISRYQSGMYPVMDLDEFEERVSYGLIIRKNNDIIN
tara:strand:+ start:1551 stop:1802 length:252 start_codon:yes stop_codon:yes gene_type:complete